MLAVRYAALAALVVWLGGMLTIEIVGGTLDGDTLGRFHLVAYACGAIVFICLFVMKFVGPPPRGFVPRVGIVTVMLGLELYSDRLQQPWAAFMPINVALGLALLFWYVPE